MKYDSRQRIGNMWVDRCRECNDQIWYHVGEKKRFTCDKLECKEARKKRAQDGAWRNVTGGKRVRKQEATGTGTGTGSGVPGDS